VRLSRYPTRARRSYRIIREVIMQVGVVLAAVFALNQVPAPVRANDQPKGREQLRGAWEVEKSEPRFEPKRLVFDGDKLTVVFDEKEKKQATIKIDPAAKPAQIDIIRDKEKSLGIYEVSGDTLRICFSPRGEKRPAEFKAGEGVILVTLKRQKK